MPHRVLLIRVFLGVVLLASLPGAAAAAGEAVVRGASTLNVRSGPGREHSSFATLTEGSKVEIQAIEGSWARIRTSAGETGYVHKAFLVPREAEAAPVEEARGEDEPPAAEVEAVLDAAPARVETETRDSHGETELPTQQTEQLVTAQQRLERLVEGLREDVSHLLETTRRRGGSLVTSEPVPTPIRVGVAAIDATESGSLLGLSIIGLVAGFVLGTIYGRRQERRRRTRVRF